MEASCCYCYSEVDVWFVWWTKTFVSMMKKICIEMDFFVSSFIIIVWQNKSYTQNRTDNGRQDYYDQQLPDKRGMFATGRLPDD